MTPGVRRADDIRDARRNVRRELLVQPKDMAPIVEIARFLGLFCDGEEMEAVQAVLDCVESAHYGLVPVYSAALVNVHGKKWKKLKILCDELAAQKLALLKPEDHERFYPEESAEADEEDE